MKKEYIIYSCGTTQKPIHPYKDGFKTRGTYPGIGCAIRPISRHPFHTQVRIIPHCHCYSYLSTSHADLKSFRPPVAAYLSFSPRSEDSPRAKNYAIINIGGDHLRGLRISQTYLSLLPTLIATTSASPVSAALTNEHAARSGTRGRMNIVVDLVLDFLGTRVERARGLFIFF